MENNNTKVIKKNEVVSSPATTIPQKDVLPNLQQIELFAEKIKHSTMAKPFEHKDKDGNVIVDTGDIIAAITLGWDMGISPAASIMLGRKLNANSYFSVLRGKELGLNAITSMSKIYVISTKNSDILALDVGIITKAILDSGTEMHYIRDYAPAITYKDLLTGKYLGHKWLFTDDNDNLRDDYFIYIKGVTTDDEVKKANDDGKIILIKHGITFVSSLRLIRKSNNIDKTFHYSLQDATDAGLYNGYHSSLIDSNTKKPLYIKGRDNWNNHPATMLRNRVTSIGGRIVVADMLQGAYSKEEAMEIVDVNSEEELETISIDK